MDTNFYDVVDTIRAVLPPMRKRKRRRRTILAIGSAGAGLVAPSEEASTPRASTLPRVFWRHFSMKWRPLASEYASSLEPWTRIREVS